MGNPGHDKTETGHVRILAQPNLFAGFRDSLWDALHHLHAPGFEAPELLYTVMGCEPGCGPAVLQSRLLAAIALLEPDESVPPRSRLGRAHESLHQRFVLGQTQEDTAERLSVSVRHLQRVQSDAVHLLARQLWDRWLAGRARVGVPPAELASGQPGPPQAADWRTQADRELASLSMSAPNAGAELSSVLEAVLELEESLVARRGVAVELASVAPDLVAATHPAALRQTLIVGIGRLSQCMSAGVISVHAAMEEGAIRVTLTAPLESGQFPSESDLVDDVIVPPGASLAARRGRTRIALELSLPSLDQRVIVVVEDNRDMVVFYRHCTAGLPYRIVHVDPGEDVVARIQELAPDAVILDVMMPHIDGWQILTHLRALPPTRGIPVIVCSVIKEEELAQALGAACYLSKPVQPASLVDALERVLHLA